MDITFGPLKPNQPLTVKWATRNQNQIKDMDTVLKLKSLLEAEQKGDEEWWVNRSFDTQRLSLRVDFTLQLCFGRNWPRQWRRAAKRLGH